MLRFIKYLILALPVLAAFPSCEQNISVDLGDYEPKIVIYSVLRPNASPEVMVTESIQYFTFENDNQQFSYLLKAQVELSDGTQSELLQLQTRKVAANYEHLDGEPTDSIIIYYYSGSMVIEEGKTYSLTVSDDGRIATATTTVPIAPEIEEGFFERRVIEDFASIDTNYVIGVYFNEQPGDNWYRMAYNHTTILYLEEDTVVEKRSPISNNFTNSAQKKDGRVYVEHTINFLRWNQEYTVGPYDITIRVHNVHRDYKEFFESLREQRRTEDNPFTEPVQVRSNISGGIGLFSSYSPSNPFLYVLHL